MSRSCPWGRGTASSGEGESAARRRRERRVDLLVKAPSSLLRALRRALHQRFLCREHGVRPGPGSCGSRRRPRRAPRRSACRRAARRGRAPISARSRESSTGASTSTRRSRLRGIRSALPIQTPTLVARLEREDPAVLEEAAEDAADDDPLAQAGHARAEDADPARDDLDRRARRRRVVERLDDRPGRRASSP